MQYIEPHIIDRCRQGDKDAFRVLMQTWQPAVYTLALRMLCDVDDAEDIVQETFIRVWENIPLFDPARSFRTWIYSIAARLCLDQLRHRAFTVPLPGDEEFLRGYLSAENSTAHELAAGELSAVIRTLAGRLSPKQRLVFTLVGLEELSVQEAAAVTGMTAEQVKANSCLARKNIKEQLKRLGYEFD